MRNQTIDIAKGIGILTVVICHNWILYHNAGEFSRVIFSFHMPLFFFISGIFFKPQLSFKQTFISKANSLLKPYIVIIVFLIIYDLIMNVTKTGQYDVLKATIKGLYASTYTLDWVPLWFLSHLFMVYLFAWFIDRFLLKKIKSLRLQTLALTIIFIIGVHFLQLFWNQTFNPFGINTLLNGNNLRPLGLPFNIDILLVTTPIFLMGSLLAKEMLGFKLNASLFWLCLTLFVYLHFQFDYTMALHTRDYGNMLISTCQMIAGIYLVFSISSILGKVILVAKTLAYLGNASLFVLIFHYSIQHIITGSLQYHLPQYAYLISLLAFAISIFYSLIIYEIVMRSAYLKQLFFDMKKK